MVEDGEGYGRDAADPPLWCPECKKTATTTHIYYTGNFSQDWDPKTRTWQKAVDQGFEMDSNPPICSDCGSELEDFEDQDVNPNINDLPAVPAKGCRHWDTHAGKCTHGLVPQLDAGNCVQDETPCPGRMPEKPGCFGTPLGKSSEQLCGKCPIGLTEECIIEAKFRARAKKS